VQRHEQQPHVDQLQQQQAEQQQKLSADHALQSCFGSRSSAGVAASGVVAFGGAVRPSGVLSLADRYEAMKSSAASRVCSGKSAIHGLGVFAKMPHKAGAQRWVCLAGAYA
jgi:hypothetical protein